MTKEIRQYLAFIAALLAQDDIATDWRRVERELLIRIGFYQHERLIHLLVMLAFAAFTAVALVLVVIIQTPVFFVLAALFLILLIPYIGHYYFLENAVQKLYKQYYIIKDKP